MTSISPFNGNTKIDNIYIRNPENKAKDLKTGPISDANKQMISSVAKEVIVNIKGTATQNSEARIKNNEESPGIIGRATKFVGNFLPSREKVGQVAGECAANTYARPTVTNGIYNLISYFAPQPEPSAFDFLWNGGKQVCGEVVRVAVDNTVTPKIMPFVTLAAGAAGAWAVPATLTAANLAFVYFTRADSQTNTEISYLQEKDFKCLENFITYDAKENKYYKTGTTNQLGNRDIQKYCRLVSICNICTRLLNTERQDIQNVINDYVLERSDKSKVLQDGYVLTKKDLKNLNNLVKDLVKSDNSIDSFQKESKKILRLLGEHSIQVRGFTKKERRIAVPEKFADHKNLNAMIDMFTSRVITTFDEETETAVYCLRNSGQVIDAKDLPQIYEGIELLLSLKSAVDSNQLLPKQLNLLLTTEATEKDLNEVKEQLNIPVEGTLSLQNLQLIYNEFDLKDSVNPDQPAEFDEDWIDLKAGLDKPSRPLDADLDHRNAEDMEKAQLGPLTIEEIEM